MSKQSATLLIQCDDQVGLVAAVTEFIQRHMGNVLHLEQHVDTDAFFMRVEWDLENFNLENNAVADAFEKQIAHRFSMSFQLFFSGEKQRMALFVSKLPHCFYDILSRYQSGEWDIEIPLIVSNHEDMRPVAEQFGIDFYHLPITADNKAEQEKRQVELLKQHKIDFIVLARYMQILTADIIDQYPNRIINIHHSFLPAFPGAKPYHSAHARGVKIIGATSHYVTADLDAGPIISQDVSRVSHSEEVDEFIRKGRDLEKTVLANALWKHMQRKTLVYKNRTIIFN